MGQHLGFRPPASNDPVEIYVLDDRNAFEHFLKFYFPELPPRRAFFLAQGQDRVVYTYSNPRLEEDLRHEATHAQLRGAFGDLPLWLDEGLAEYFETDLSRPDAERPRLEQIAADIRGGWSPNLERLESMTDIRQMTQRDYREAWGWVHLFLNGPEPGRSLLMGYLHETDRTGDKARLSPRLAQAKITNDRLLAHLKTLQAGAVAAKPAREAGDSATARWADRPAGRRRTTRDLAAVPGVDGVLIPVDKHGDLVENQSLGRRSVPEAQSSHSLTIRRLMTTIAILAVLLVATRETSEDLGAAATLLEVAEANASRKGPDYGGGRYGQCFRDEHYDGNHLRGDFLRYLDRFRDHWGAMERKYRYAASHPWVEVEADPPAPSYP